jgi:hypothetical protein
VQHVQARRAAGGIEASTPASAATTVNTTSGPIGRWNPMPWSDSPWVTDDAEREPERRADQGGDHALLADHAAGPAARHPDRPQHPELARPLEHDRIIVLSAPGSAFTNV